ncbi:G-protein coupled receptor 4-like [Micropterus salmoides]|uniref:G-protein coupled receptor 4-like n=1 Tax=Micropterus salmoides TaxID=27706 RepID=UPI0018EB46D5|nr:G-protein coupled receptor 4-like [Micropterus salmoides]XP_038586200.1 G-protein coupled receptor 4-like [Micropterus salmoides]
MEEFYFNSLNQSFDYWNITSDYYPCIDYTELDDYNNNPDFIPNVVTYVIVAVGLPLTLVAIYALYSMVRSDHVAPIYLINLLITDLIQLCCMIADVAPTVDEIISDIFMSIYFSALFASVYFMVCVALERYLVIAHPLWYSRRLSIKTSVVVCVLVWVLSGVCGVCFYVFVENLGTYIMFAILFLLPFLLLIFCLVGTLKALSASTSVPSDEKRRTVGVLVLLLLIYTLLFLPSIIFYLDVIHDNFILCLMIVRFSPLADSVLYVFMRKGFIDKLLASVCCCRMDSNDISSPSV